MDLARREVQRLVVTQLTMFPEYAPNRRTIHRLSRVGVRIARPPRSLRPSHRNLPDMADDSENSEIS